MLQPRNMGIPKSATTRNLGLNASLERWDNATHSLIFFRYNAFMSDVKTIRLTETVKAAG
jgi:hypothetical protein